VSGIGYSENAKNFVQLKKALSLQRKIKQWQLLQFPRKQVNDRVLFCKAASKIALKQVRK
jgi:hypothetical protein